MVNKIFTMTCIVPIDHDFPNYIAKLLASVAVNPLIVKDIDDSPLSFLFQHDVPAVKYKQLTYNAYRLMKMIDNCHICAKRFSLTYAISDLDHSVWQCLKNVDSEYKYSVWYQQLVKFAESSCDTPITNLIMLDQDTLFGHSVQVGKFYHITRPIKAENQTICDDIRKKLICDAITQYVFSDNFEKFMSQLILKSKDSLDILKKCLSKEPFGDKFIPAIDWCISILTNISTYSKNWNDFTPKEKIAFALHHIIRADLSTEYDKTVAKIFHTAKNFIIELLEHANDETLLITMCRKNLDPLNFYTNKIATDDQIVNGIKCLGDFQNTVMTIARAKELIPEIISHPKVIFYDSTNYQHLKWKIYSITSFRAFVKFIRENPEVPVEICVKDEQIKIGMLIETTFDKEHINTRHINYNTNQKPSFKVGLNRGPNDYKWTPVSYTIPIYEYFHENAIEKKIEHLLEKILFVTPDINEHTLVGNCLNGGFFESPYNNISNSVFDRLNKSTNIVVPEEPKAIGYLASSWNFPTWKYPSVTDIRVYLRIGGFIIYITCN